MKNSKTAFISPLFTAVTLLLVVTGCRTPDLKPFRDSTAKIHDGVVAARDMYPAELGRLQPYVPDEHKLAQEGKRFMTNWQARVEVMEGLVRYADSLAAVADAPDKSKAGLENVAQSLKELSVAAGPYQPAIDGATDIAIELVDLANRVRAVKQLKDAVLLTDTNVQRVAKLLALDFARLRFNLEQNQKSIRTFMDNDILVQLKARQAVEEKVRSQPGSSWET